MILIFLGKQFAQQKKTNYYWQNKSKFVSLKRILPILSIILLTAIHSMGQASRPAPQQDTEDKIIKLYPNPAISYVTFDFQKKDIKGFSIQIYNFLGRKMYETQNITDKTTITLTDFNRGVYVYHLRDQNGRIIESGKFQVSR